MANDLLHSLDHDDLRTLSGITSDDGVLTVTVGRLPEDPNDHARAQIAVDNARRALLEGVDGADRQRLTDELDRISDALDEVVAPSTPGRGRLLVAVLDGSSEPRVHRFQLPLPTRMRVAPHAVVRDLVGLVDRGRRRTVLGLHHDGLRVFDVTAGRVEEVAEHSVDFGDAQLADVKSGPGGRPHMRGNVNVERFEDRLDANRERQLASALRDAVSAARERGAEHFVLTGPARLVSELRDGVDAPWVSTHDHDLARAGLDEVAKLTDELVDTERPRRLRDLVADVRDRVAAGGRGVVGLAGVVAALAEGRVDHLLFTGNAAAEGYVAEDGRLVLGRGSDGQHEPEPWFVDRVLHRALTTDADVTLVDLDDADVVLEEQFAAVLRW